VIDERAITAGWESIPRATPQLAAGIAAIRALAEQLAPCAPMAVSLTATVYAPPHARLAVVPILLACTCCPSRARPPTAGDRWADRQHLRRDLDRTADPCTDFYQFANGSWRAQHPIPSSMPRWSRRWESGELAKERLKDILGEVSAKTDWPARSVEQLIGDFYGACMDDTRADQLGAAPVQPLLDRIAAITTARAAGDDHRAAPDRDRRAVRVYATPENHDPTNVVANIAASGLGLPTRLLRQGRAAIRRGARDVQDHVAAVFALAGRKDADALAATVFDFETRLAKASLDNITLRDPKVTTQDGDRPGRRARAELRLDRVHQGDVAADDAGQRHGARVHQAARARADRHADRRLADLSRVARARERVAGAVAAVRRRRLRVQREVPVRRRRAEAAVEACAEATDACSARRSAKSMSRSIPARGQGAVMELVRNELAAMKDTIEG